MEHRFCPHCSFRLDGLKVIEWGGWRFDEASGELSAGGKKLEVTRPQGRLVSTLLRAEGRTVDKRTSLWSAMIGNRPEEDWPELNTLDVQISKLRRDLRKVFGKDVLINTLFNRGYNAVPADVEAVVRFRVRSTGAEAAL